MNTVDLRGDIPVIADIINNELEGEFVDDTFTSVRQNMFRDCTKLTKVTMPNVTTIGQYAFANTGLTEITEDDFPNVTHFQSYAFSNCPSLRKATFTKPTTITCASGQPTNQNIFYGCADLEVYFPNLETLAASSYGNLLTGASIPNILPKHFPKLTTISGRMSLRAYNVIRCILPKITYADWGMFTSTYCGLTLKVVRFPSATVDTECLQTFSNSSICKGFKVLRLLDVKHLDFVKDALFYWTVNTVLETIILRDTESICTLASTTGEFVKNSPLKSGGAGVDIYVPAALLDEYKAATNWVTLVEDYGTARFHALEGSIYEDPNYDYDIGMED